MCLFTYIRKQQPATERTVWFLFFFFLFLYSTFYGEESAFLFLLWLDFQCSSVLVAIVLKPVNRGIRLGLWIKKKPGFFEKEKVNGLMIEFWIGLTRVYWITRVNKTSFYLFLFFFNLNRSRLELVRSRSTYWFLNESGLD